MADIVANREGAKLVMEKLGERYPRTRLVWSDRGYDRVLEILKPPRRWVRVPAGEEPPSYPKGFILLPRVGSGEGDRVDLPEQEDDLWLRVPTRDLGGADPRCHDRVPKDVSPSKM